MAANKARCYECQVVSETVSIRLTTRRVGGFDGQELPFVQCDQLDCQYVDENRPPCPLTTELYAEELAARQARAQRRAEEEF